MIANYHTHTVRCGHVTGTEREYVEQAVRRGLKVLGFADHSPYLFDGGYVSPMRMRPEQTRGYCDEVRFLAKEYESDIKVLVGVEMEYYPKAFARTIDWMKQFRFDHLLLGQHMPGTEPELAHCIIPSDDKGRFASFIDQMIEAVDTGLFTYVAHPDMYNFTGDRNYYLTQVRRFCRKAADADIPLEFNLLGFTEGRCYPNEDFFRTAAECGNRVILGCDAHSPARVADEDEVSRATSYLAGLGITPVETVETKPLL